ncbi:hypothetical protein [uncultured Methanomethylovorans sp.]|uniref:hypothetical protein n=1 Tax=uncultured Methanomethylovorans sp. TaxID=183759 RepID=UPI00260521E4|nr:hypothetical protein [uncultured Methanomethylovorans sp.]
MNTKEMEGAGHAPNIENCAAVYSNDTNLFIKSGSCVDKEFYELRKNPLIHDFANVSDETYALVAQTNPTLKLFFDVAKRICSEGAEG